MFGMVFVCRVPQCNHNHREVLVDQRDRFVDRLPLKMCALNTGTSAAVTPATTTIESSQRFSLCVPSCVYAASVATREYPGQETLGQISARST
jgi:hypothetical protein